MVHRREEINKLKAKTRNKDEVNNIDKYDLTINGT